MLKRFLSMIKNTKENELSCDDVLELIDQFAELAIEGKNVSEIMPQIQQHLDMCPDCREEYESLLEILKHNRPNN
jgi:predicted anti-sigma-YlaC factor YlaD